MSLNPFDGYKKAHATFALLGEAGLFKNNLDAILRKPGNADRAVAVLMREFELSEINEFAIDLEAQLAQFEVQLPKLRELGFTFNGQTDEQLIQMLRETAPDWPKGKRCFRSIQIREGEGDAGVQHTFDLHERMMKKAFAPKWWRWPKIETDKKHLRLLAGNDSHEAVFGWVCADMNANRQRDSITAVRSGDSLSDELLAFCWQFPRYCKAIDYEESPGLFAAGYELSVEGCEDWSDVPIVTRYLHAGEVYLGAYRRAGDYSDFSVPSRLRE